MTITSRSFSTRSPCRQCTQLRQESLAFEHRHNSTYRYSKIKGKTPLKALAGMEKKLVFPSKSDAPRHPLDKPEEGCYHLVRFIRSDCRLNIFGEMFSGSTGDPVRIRCGYYRCQRTKAKALPGYDPGRRIQVSTAITMIQVTTSHHQTVSEFRVNDVVTIISSERCPERCRVRSRQQDRKRTKQSAVETFIWRTCPLCRLCRKASC